MGFSSSAVQIDSRAAIERAVFHIDNGDFSLARSYLELPLIDQRITITERSRAYYLQGYSFEKQYLFRSAVQEYTKALAFNPANPATLTALGYLNYNGLGVNQDKVEATQLLSAAAQLDHPPAMTGLATLLLEGQGVEQDVNAARDWLVQATHANHAPAYVILAKSYRRPYADPPNPNKARLYYEKAMVLNQPEALLALGYMHLNGEFDPADARKAAELFGRASATGLAAAQSSLAYLHLTGRGIEQDNARAKALYAEAARQGDASAHYGLAYLLETATDLDADPQANAAARSHYLSAARAGYGLAQLALSRLARAAGDQEQALSWLRRAAQQGAVRAYNRLAWQLATDTNPAFRDGQEAVLYARKALAARRTSATLDTLAAAYAEAAQFEDAIKTQREALAFLDREEQIAQHPDTQEQRQQGPAALANPSPSTIRDEYRARLQSYEAGQPWREPAPAARNDAATGS